MRTESVDKTGVKLVPEGRDFERASAAARIIRNARRRVSDEDAAVLIPEIELPRGVAQILEELLAGLASGTVMILSTAEGDQELSTTQAAGLLGMSRPTLINLLESGEIPYRKVGTHRRLSLADVLAYRESTERGPAREAEGRRERRLAALKAMAELTHDAGQGY